MEKWKKIETKLNNTVIGISSTDKRCHKIGGIFRTSYVWKQWIEERWCMGQIKFIALVSCKQSRIIHHLTQVSILWCISAVQT